MDVFSTDSPWSWLLVRLWQRQTLGLVWPSPVCPPLVRSPPHWNAPCVSLDFWPSPFHQRCREREKKKSSSTEHTNSLIWRLTLAKWEQTALRFSGEAHSAAGSILCLKTQILFSNFKWINYPITNDPLWSNILTPNLTTENVLFLKDKNTFFNLWVMNPYGVTWNSNGVPQNVKQLIKITDKNIL